MSFDWVTGGCVLQEEQHSKVKGRGGGGDGAGQGASALAPGSSRCPWRAASQSPGHSLELRSVMGATRGLDGESSLCPPCPLSKVTQKGSQCEGLGPTPGAQRWRVPASSILSPGKCEPR